MRPIDIRKLCAGEFAGGVHYENAGFIDPDAAICKKQQITLINREIKIGKP